MQKHCYKCELDKPLEEFAKDKTTPDGLQYACRECMRIAKASYRNRTRHTVEWFKQKTWENLNGRTVNGKYPQSVGSNRGYLVKGVRLELTKDQWAAFVTANAALIEAMYARGDKPSLDRIDASKHYSLDNIRVITHKENSSNVSRTNKNKKNEAA